MTLPGGMAEVGTTAGGAKERRYVKSIKKVMKKACFQTKTSLFGGDKRDRTADLMTASHALSRLERLHTPANRAETALQYTGTLLC